MNPGEWLRKLHIKWLKLTIKRKITLFTGMVFFIITLSILFNLGVVRIALGDFKGALEQNLISSDYMDAMEYEAKCFQAYMKTPSDNGLEELIAACRKTKRVIDRLPYDYSSMSLERYAMTWSIKNSYTVYEKKRDSLLAEDESTQNYIQDLYEVYDMQEFLQDYSKTLVRYALEDQNVVYRRHLPFIQSILWWVIVVGCLLMLIMLNLAKLLHKTLITPIVNLVACSKKIASNDFFIEDVVVENQDEMGDLVKAFNKMKYATGEYINTLEEKRAALDLLHKQELEKLEIEKRLEGIKLELLKNQINPHFLFNTLNVIAGMASLEEAETTEKMINALSSLFRYNLKTTEPETTLAQELRIVQNYMYLQKMRFGDRIEYSIDCDLDIDNVIVPTFLFQPLVENAIIHGISKKEEGGKIIIHIWKEDAGLYITVTDTGIGMTKEELDSLCEAFQSGNTGRIGIGLGNIYKRIHSMYPEGKLTIESREQEGTVITILIPQED